MDKPFDSAAFYRQYHQAHPNLKNEGYGAMFKMFWECYKAGRAHRRGVEHQIMKAEAAAKAAKRWSWSKRMWLIFMPASFVLAAKFWSTLGIFTVFIPTIAFFISAIVHIVQDDNKRKAENPEYVTTWELSSPFLLAYVVFKSPVIIAWIIMAALAAYTVWSR